MSKKTGIGGRIIPALHYKNAAVALDWLCAAFGFSKHMVVPGEGGRIAHAQLSLGNGMVMLGDAETECGRLVAAPSKGQPVTQGIYVVVDDADAHYARAKDGGAEIVIDIKTQAMAAATTRRATSKAMSGPSAPTILGCRDSESAARASSIFPTLSR